MHTQIVNPSVSGIVIHASLNEIEVSRDNRFTVVFNGEQYQSVFPEPLSELSCTFSSKQKAWAYLVTQRVLHPQSDIWPLDCPFHVAQILWSIFGNVQIDDDDYIEVPFLHFAAGTDRFDVWLWFENYFGLSVMTDLMKLIGVSTNA